MTAKERADALGAPVSVRRLVLRFAAAGLVALAVAIGFTAVAAARVGTDQAVADARRVGWVSGKGLVAPVLDPAVLTGDPGALARLDRVVHDDVLGGSLVRVKLWREDGTIVYSDERRLIGERFALDDDERALFATGDTAADTRAAVSDLSEPENRFETETKLLEVYSPVRATDGTPLVLETYFRYSGVTDVGRDLWTRFAPVAIGALILLELIQIPFAWSMARRLRTGQRHRERLLRHAIEASDAERRRIARDLHDGVVQELTGVSLKLAAEARGGAAGGAQLTAASARMRDSIRSLRSLLVDIYPPNLYEEGLEAALADLLAPLEARDIRTRLDVATDRTFDTSTMALCYRCAREAVRNVVAHARASSVEVVVTEADGGIVLLVEDDGEGFTADAAARQAAAGHLGLRGLRDLLAEAGGRLDIRSAAGSRTRLTIRLPGRP